MIRSFAITLMLLCSIVFGQTETVLLKGTVKKTGGSVGIAGVKVSLAKLSTLSTTTGVDGAFTITSTSVQAPTQQTVIPQFTLKGNELVLSPIFQNSHAKIDIFSSDGKIKESILLNNSNARNSNVMLPKLGSGISIVRFTLGQKSYTRTLVCLGNDLFIKKEVSTLKTNDDVMLAKQSATSVKDTLVCAKEGYVTKKQTVDSYTKQDIQVTLDSGSSGPCTREALQAIADKYVEAQKAGDPSKMPLASQVTYMLNFKTVTEDKSFCKKAIKIDTTRVFCDVDSCRAFVEIISANNTPPYVLITWLKVNNGQVTNITAIVSTTGDWAFNAADYLKNSKPQNWEILPDSMRVSRQTLINGANAYLDAFVPKTKSDTIPWGIPCERIEGGASTGSGPNATCNVGVPDGVQITDRSYAVDLEKATVDVFCQFGGGMPDSHMFRSLKGKYRYVHTLSIQNKDLP